MRSQIPAGDLEQVHRDLQKLTEYCAYARVVAIGYLNHWPRG